MKLILHAHSNWSHDGVFSILEWVNILSQNKFSGVCLTEHEESGWDAEKYQKYKSECEAYSNDNIKIIPGIEFNQEGYHILCYGLKSYPERPSTLRQLSENISKQNCFLVLAHPSKYDWKIPKYFFKYLHGVEVWNSKFIYEGKLGPSLKSFKFGLNNYIGQDIHKYKHISNLFVNIDSSEDKIIEFLKKCKFEVFFSNKKINLNSSNFIMSIVDLRHYIVSFLLQIRKKIRNW